MTAAAARERVVSDLEPAQPSIGRASSASCAMRVPRVNDDPGANRARAVN
jgi:hypothetical protein